MIVAWQNVPGTTRTIQRGLNPRHKAKRLRLYLPMGERQSWSEAPHEQLVGAFRGLIQKGRQEILNEGLKTTSLTPAIMLKHELSKQTSLNIGHPERFDEQRAAFFKPIEDAWDVIAYEHYRWEGTGEPSGDRHYAGLMLSHAYQRATARHEPRPEFIKLAPQQARILDALAEAAEVPHQRGQTEIEIPEHLRDYEERVREYWRRRGK